MPLVALNIGNPQAVILGTLPDDRRFARLGAAIERHEMFPEGTNLEFAQVESPIAGAHPHLGARRRADLVVGHRLVCVAGRGRAFGGASRDAEVVAPGGAQRVEWRDDSVYLTGWAEVLCDGTWLRPLVRQ